jgi:hypothetical protein
MAVDDYILLRPVHRGLHPRVELIGLSLSLAAHLCPVVNLEGSYSFLSLARFFGATTPQYNRPTHNTHDKDDALSRSFAVRVGAARIAHTVHRCSPSCRIAFLHTRSPPPPPPPTRRRLPRAATDCDDEYGTGPVRYRTTLAIGCETISDDNPNHLAVLIHSRLHLAKTNNRLTLIIVDLIAYRVVRDHLTRQTRLRICITNRAQEPVTTFISPATTSGHS